MRMEFTPREVAELSGASKRTVEKAIEEKVIQAHVAKKGTKGRRVLPFHAVPYVKIIGTTKFRMDLATKRKLAGRLARLSTKDLGVERFELAPAVEMDVGRLIGNAAERAERYGSARNEVIVEDEGILGGTPVIRGTRISVYSILGRIEGGDSIDEVLADYPMLTRGVVETAVIYARSHPPVGRPGGKPWAKAAAA